MSNLNVEAVKASLRGAQWRKVKDVSIEGAAGPVTLTVRRIPMEKLVAVRKEWQQEGLLTEKDEPRDADAALEINRRLLAMVLFLPDGVRPLFEPDELKEMPWVDELLPEVQEAFAPITKAMESAKGN
jgi:hypothetical protein